LPALANAAAAMMLVNSSPTPASPLVRVVTFFGSACHFAFPVRYTNRKENEGNEALMGTKGNEAVRWITSMARELACCYKFGRARSFGPRRPIFNMRAVVAAHGSLMRENIGWQDAGSCARFPRVTVLSDLYPFGLGRRLTYMKGGGEQKRKSEG
jgi:hypothetical protein